MRILVINAHPSSPEGQRAFNRFFDCVKEALKVYVDFLDLEDGCLVRTKDNLDDFLYGERGNYSSKTAAKRFDALDIIIVSGDVTLLPWSHGAVKLLVLLRMCVQVKKCLFACGTAMDALVYLSASDLDSAIRVINGNGRGTKLGEINNLVIPESKLGEIDCFLDATTGDLYTLKHSSKEWLPFCNVGLHNIRMAQEYNTLGKYVIQAPVYRPKKVIEDRTQNNRFYESHEILCYTKKHYSNHWLFAGCGLEFIVPHKSRWHVHSFTFTNLDKAFQVIAESKEGPLIIEYPNIIGVKFDLDKRYPQTLVLLTNFLTKYSKDIMAINRKENLSIKKELEVKYHRMEQIVFKKEKQKLSTVESTCISIGGGRARDQRTNKVVIRHMKHNSMGSPDDAEAIKHSGWAIKKSDPHEYKHNYIAPGKMPIEAYQQNLSKGGHRKSSVTAMINELFNNRSQVEKAAVTERPSYSVLNSPKDAKVIPIKNFHRKMSTGEFEAFDMIDEDQDKNKNREESIDFSAVITKSTARKILYPDLPDLRATFEKRSWIPGSLSSRKRDDTYEGSSVKVVKVDDGKYKPKSSRLFTARDGEETSPYKTIRASDPYQSAYDINKQYERKESEKIIGHRVFITSSKVTEKNNGFEENSRSPGRMASTTSGFYRH